MVPRGWKRCPVRSRHSFRPGRPGPGAARSAGDLVKGPRVHGGPGVEHGLGHRPEEPQGARHDQARAKPPRPDPRTARSFAGQRPRARLLTRRTHARRHQHHIQCRPSRSHLDQHEAPNGVRRPGAARGVHLTRRTDGLGRGPRAAPCLRDQRPVGSRAASDRVGGRPVEGGLQPRRTTRLRQPRPRACRHGHSRARPSRHPPHPLCHRVPPCGSDDQSAARPAAPG